MDKNMTQGNPYKLLIAFTLPLFVGNLFQQIYSMVDTVVVGRYVGVDALAALGAVSGFSFMVTGFAQGLGCGFAVLVSQCYGAGDKERMRRAYAMSVVLSLVVGLVISLLCFAFSMPLLRMVRTPGNIIGMANDYISIIYLGLLACIYYNLFSAILRAVGDSRSPLLFLVLSSILNVVLDLVLVLVIPLGCAGVAIATILSQAISAIIAYVYISRRFPDFRFRKEDFKFDIPLAKTLLKTGLPGAVQFSVCALGVIIVQIAINDFGSDIVAAYSIGNKIETLITQMFTALGMAISTYAGQNLGARDFNRIRQGFRACFVLTVAWAVISYLLSFVVSEPLAYVFIDSQTTDPDVIDNALLYVGTVVKFFIPLGMIFLFRTGCQGLGSGLIPMVSSITELTARAIAAFTLPIWFGYLGICYASPAAWVAAAIILPFCYVLQMRRIRRQLDRPATA